MSRTGADGTSRNYVLNYATGLPSVSTIQSGGSDLRYYVYTPGGSLLYSIDAASNTHRYYSFDDTGSTTFLTDDTGAITDSYGISAYGDIVTAGAKNSTDNPFTWQGQFGVMQEPGTKLYYARFRYYDSATARFLSRDPLFSPAPKEVNPYQYAAGNPVANGDPTGLKTVVFGPMSATEREMRKRAMEGFQKEQFERDHPPPWLVDYYPPFNSTMVSQLVGTVEVQPVPTVQRVDSYSWPSMQSLTESSYGEEAEEFWTNFAAAIASRDPIKNQGKEDKEFWTNLAAAIASHDPIKNP